MEDEILDHIYDSLPADVWGASFYPAREDHDAELYIETPDGKCWQVIVNHHPHRG